MIGALVTGDLIADPVERTTQAGKPFTTATLRVPAGAKARWAREKGEKVIVADSPSITFGHLSVSAAAVVGMGRQRYEQAMEVVEAGKQAEMGEFFGALKIGLDQLYDAADALRHVGQSIAEECSTPDECIADMNEIVSLIFTGCTSILDAVNLRITVHEVAG